MSFLGQDTGQFLTHSYGNSQCQPSTCGQLLQAKTPQRWEPGCLVMSSQPASPFLRMGNTISIFQACLLHAKMLQFCLTLCDPMDCSLPGLQGRILCPWDSSAKNTGEGCHAFLQGIFLTQGSNLHLLHCRWILHPLSLLSFLVLQSCFSQMFSKRGFV